VSWRFGGGGLGGVGGQFIIKGVLMDKLDELFDDIVIDYEGDKIVGYWSQVCQKCLHEHDLDLMGITSECAGEPICGVKGCNNTAMYYYDFPQDVIPENPQDNQKAATEEPYPSEKQMWQWMFDGVAEATDGCRVEPDGRCVHGKPSWFLALGLI
jgi:hypothetical protein